MTNLNLLLIVNSVGLGRMWNPQCSTALWSQITGLKSSVFHNTPWNLGWNQWINTTLFKVWKIQNPHCISAMTCHVVFASRSLPVCFISNIISFAGCWQLRPICQQACLEFIPWNCVCNDNPVASQDTFGHPYKHVHNIEHRTEGSSRKLTPDLSHPKRESYP